jgi:hypothetical protein
MGWDSDFLDLMPHSVVVSTRTGHSAYGTASFSADGSTYRARVLTKPGFVRGPQGENVAFHTIVWVASTGAIDISSRLTLPDGTTPPIVGLERVPDEDGTYHHKIMCGF